MPLSSTNSHLDTLGRNTFEYFRRQVNPENGLVADRADHRAPASIAATGLALACYPVAVERGYWSRSEAIAQTLAALRFFQNSEHNSRSNATGYRGFYYHFLDMHTGQRVWRCELSTIDTALLIGGMLTAAVYFDGADADERDIRDLAQELYARVDWNWARAGGPLLTQGWKPGTGFLPNHYQGYDETLIMQLLALGSPTHAIPQSSYELYTSTYKWETHYGIEYIAAGPLFIHQFSHAWIDFRGLQDAPMRAKGIDYFENSRRATYVQREYACHNPLGFKGYGENCWGLSASDGPGETTLVVDGVTRHFFDYKARGVPDGPDDGTLCPRAVIASLPFAPEIVVPAIEQFHESPVECDVTYGCCSAFNPTFPCEDKKGWSSSSFIGIDEGAVLMMLENYHSGLIWELMRSCQPLREGLKRADFRGGWLNE